jgi:hypothetical protein
MAIATVSVGLPIAAALGLVDIIETIRVLHQADSGRVGQVAGTCRQVAELTCRASRPRDAAAGRGCGACAVVVFGHPDNLAFAVVGIGLPVAATHGLIDIVANLGLGHADSAIVGRAA